VERESCLQSRRGLPGKLRAGDRRILIAHLLTVREPFRIAIAPQARGAHARKECVIDRDIERCADIAALEATDADREASAQRRLGLVRLQQDRATDRIATEQRALRSA